MGRVHLSPLRGVEEKEFSIFHRAIPILKPSGPSTPGGVLRHADPHDSPGGCPVLYRGFFLRTTGTRPSHAFVMCARLPPVPTCQVVVIQSLWLRSREGESNNRNERGPSSIGNPRGRSRAETAFPEAVTPDLSANILKWKWKEPSIIIGCFQYANQSI